MACYISSNNNRLYAALESSFGVVAGVTAAHRFTAMSLAARQQTETPRRKDKTGSRTFQGIQGGLRRRTSFDLRTYVYGRTAGSEVPRYGALMQAALGAAPAVSMGLNVAAINGTSVTFGQAHGLRAGSAVVVQGEMRFVRSVLDGQSVLVNAPFTDGQTAGAVAGGAVVYALAVDLPTVSVHDYWTPGTAVQRILRGAAVDEMEIRVNGDFHEIRFSGEAADVIDSASFQSGEGGLTQLPAEPALQGLSEMPVPGHLGQVWIGTGANRLFTLSDARVVVKNNMEFRTRDFGTLVPRCLVPGQREVTVDLEMYGQDKPVFEEIYQAARQRSPIPLMLQLGEQDGALCGVFLPSFVPAVPEFDSEESRMRWRLKGSQAMGSGEDEIYVAFG
ncbi:phage tail tube protein [uncultured Paludibaculum sp.]|uniref:phage tail tube protein n=1 Tax=uncultured Paludibaculum sp. TaxID=1765020 RepID=UPI002AAB1215|nr:phage tail tube protein [uncultured Paludibaculum sp.]